jgi:hypothetical protein
MMSHVEDSKGFGRDEVYGLDYPDPNYEGDR